MSNEKSEKQNKVLRDHLVEKVCFSKKCLFSIPIPKPLSPGKGLSVGLPPSPSKDACSQSHTVVARCNDTND